MMNCISIASHSSCIFETEAGAALKPSRRWIRMTLSALFGPSCTKLSAQSRAESPPPTMTRFLPAKSAGFFTR